MVRSPGNLSGMHNSFYHILNDTALNCFMPRHESMED